MADEALAARCLRGRVVVVDDDSEILYALNALFLQEGYACETYASAQAYLQVLNINQACFPGPGCVLSDVKMSGMDGLELQRRLTEWGDTPLLLMSGASAIEDAVLAFRAGALDFLVKPLETELLLATVANALAVSVQRQQQRLRQSTLSARVALLTQREREIAGRVAAGQTNPMIADALNIALRTVKLHRQRAMEKLGASCTADLVRIADEGGLV